MTQACKGESETLKGPMLQHWAFELPYPRGCDAPELCPSLARRSPSTSISWKPAEASELRGC
jgi:hypothetical protein